MAVSGLPAAIAPSDHADLPAGWMQIAPRQPACSSNLGTLEADRREDGGDAKGERPTEPAVPPTRQTLRRLRRPSSPAGRLASLRALGLPIKRDWIADLAGAPASCRLQCGSGQRVAVALPVQQFGRPGQQLLQRQKRQQQHLLRKLRKANRVTAD